MVRINSVTMFCFCFYLFSGWCPGPTYGLALPAFQDSTGCIPAILFPSSYCSPGLRLFSRGWGGLWSSSGQEPDFPGNRQQKEPVGPALSPFSGNEASLMLYTRAGVALATPVQSKGSDREPQPTCLSTVLKSYQQSQQTVK